LSGQGMHILPPPSASMGCPGGKISPGTTSHTVTRIYIWLSQIHRF
jgi:hypothetical protein